VVVVAITAILAIWSRFFIFYAHFTLLPNCQLDRHKSKSRKCRCLDSSLCVCVCVCVYMVCGVLGVCSHCAHNILFNAHFVHNLLLMNASAMLGWLPFCLC